MKRLKLHNYNRIYNGQQQLNQTKTALCEEEEDLI
jgi:hypothetical protein